MVTDNALSWFAGALDAEGSFGLRRHTVRKTQVTANAFFGMADRRTVEHAKRIAEVFYGPLVTHERQPTRRSIRPFFCFNMTRKKDLFVFLRALIPFLRVKKLEALAQYDFLARASKGRHIGSEHDFWLCAMSERLKRADAPAKRELLIRVRDDFEVRGNEAAWLAGYTDGDGCISATRAARTSLLSYSAMNRAEMESIAVRVHAISGSDVPIVTPMKSRLSKKLQWRFDLRERGLVNRMIATMEPFLVTKRSQAQLALLFASEIDNATRDQAIELIQGLNHGSVSNETAQAFLRGRLDSQATPL